METATRSITEIQEEITKLKDELRQAQLSAEPKPIQDFSFETEAGTVTLSSLFGGSHDLLIWHNMGKGCDYCTLWADGLNGQFRQIENRCPIVMVSPDKVHVQKDLATKRGWEFKLVRDADKAFTTDLGFYSQEKGYWPGISSFYRDDSGQIFHVNSAIFGPGDDFCLLWPALDLLKGGAEGFEPEPA